MILKKNSPCAWLFSTVLLIFTLKKIIRWYSLRLVISALYSLWLPFNGINWRRLQTKFIAHLCYIFLGCILYEGRFVTKSSQEYFIPLPIPSPDIFKSRAAFFLGLLGGRGSGADKLLLVHPNPETVALWDSVQCWKRYPVCVFR